MDPEEKRLKLTAIDMALEEVKRVIKTMEENNYPEEQIAEFKRKNWDLLSHQYFTRKS